MAVTRRPRHPLEPDDPAAFRALVRELLPELNRRDLVALTRADLVGAMDPELVKRSEVAYLNAVFHIVALRDLRLSREI